MPARQQVLVIGLFVGGNKDGPSGQIRGVI